MSNLGRVLAIVNPAAHNGDGARAAAFLRYAHGGVASPFETLEIATTREPGHATELAREAKDIDTLLAVGGDGLVHEAFGGLMSLPPSMRPSFALLPCGNGNDYARTLGMPLGMEQAFQALMGAQARAADIGTCNGEPFAQTLSFGLDAAIALGTHERRKRTGHTGTRLFVEEGANQLLFHRDVYQYACTCDAGVKQGRMHLLAVQVGPTYGGGFKICPEADASDGLLDCCVARAPLSLAKAAFIFAAAKDGKHVGNTDIFDFFQAQRLHLEFDQAPPAQIDGERIEGSTFDISLERDALNVYYAAGNSAS